MTKKKNPNENIKCCGVAINKLYQDSVPVLGISCELQFVLPEKQKRDIHIAFPVS